MQLPKSHVPVNIPSSLLHSPIYRGSSHNFILLHYIAYIIDFLHVTVNLGLNTGAGKPAVLPKWVMQVQVRFSFLAHRYPYLQYFEYAQVNSNMVILIFTVFSLFFPLFFSKFIMSHHDGTNMALSATHTSWQPALFSHSRSHSTSEIV